MATDDYEQKNDGLLPRDASSYRIHDETAIETNDGF
jgi:hypothetical protein